MKLHVLLVLALMSLRQLAFAQFAPPAGQPGTTAIHKDNPAFVGWATTCEIFRGYKDISNTSLGVANFGQALSALGRPDTNGVVSLGDSGMAILQFDYPITNGPGWDFAVFENAFSDTYLELAFVEVKSPGSSYYRFPATSTTQTSVQVDGFGSIDATHINNLAGKYRADFGTPFDLEELASMPGLDVNNITHIRLTDAVGCIQNEYATTDHHGNKVNDPWNTPFGSGGFDLDAVGVLHNTLNSSIERVLVQEVSLYPNPSDDGFSIDFHDAFDSEIRVTVTNALGIMYADQAFSKGDLYCRIETQTWPSGTYFVIIQSGEKRMTHPLTVIHR